jgi:opacity protein-like surface antigen
MKRSAIALVVMLSFVLTDRHMFAATGHALATEEKGYGQVVSMVGRSSLELNVGLWSGLKTSNSIGIGGIQTEAKAAGFVGGILFTHWAQEYLSITLNAGLLAGKASTSVGLLSVTQRVSTVSPVLFGVRYYALGSGADGEVRPYLSGAVGVYLGSEESNTILAQESRTETAFGGRVGAGLDFFLSDHFKLGAAVGYNLMTDFDAQIGGRMNYNGGDAVLGLGYIF